MTPQTVTVDIHKTSYDNLLKKHFGEEWELARAIMLAESNGNPKAIGYNCVYNKRVKACKIPDRHKAISHDGGLLQISDQHIELSKVLDPEKNIIMAKKIRDSQGWNAWFTYKNNKHLKYLN